MLPNGDIIVIPIADSSKILVQMTTDSAFRDTHFFLNCIETPTICLKMIYLKEGGFSLCWMKILFFCPTLKMPLVLPRLFLFVPFSSFPDSRSLSAPLFLNRTFKVACTLRSSTYRSHRSCWAVTFDWRDRQCPSSKFFGLPLKLVFCQALSIMLNN